MSLKRKKKKRKRSVKSVSEVDASRFVDAQAFAGSILSIVKKQDPLAMLMSKVPKLAKVRDWIPTRFPWFDWMLSDGRGLPVGRAIQVWGPSGTCKSSFVQSLIKPFQEKNGVAAYHDLEYAVDIDWLKGYGIDLDRFVLVRPPTLEETWDSIFAILKLSKENPDTPLLLIWDSLVQSLPKSEAAAKSVGDVGVASVARINSRACRKLLQLLSRRHATIVFVNQTRTKIGTTNPYEDPNMRPGGQGIEFVSTAIIRTNRAQLSRERKKRKEVWGYKISMRTDKNRLAKPHRRCEIIVDFNGGPNEELSLQHFLKQTGFIVAAGKNGSKLKGYSETFKSDDWADFHRENKKAVRFVVHKALEYLSS